MSTSRVQREVIQYATHGGKAGLKSRPLGAFAPTASKAAAQQAQPPQLSAAVLEYLRKVNQSKTVDEKKALAISGSVVKAVEGLSAAPADAAVSLGLRRVVLKSQTARFDVAALAALELGALHPAKAGKAVALLVVVDGPETARLAAAHMMQAYGLPPPTILDGTVKLPPALAAVETIGGALVAMPVVVSTAAALQGVDKRSAVWKQLQFMLIDAGRAALLPPSAKAEVEKVGHALACERIVVVAATPEAAVQPCLAWLLPEKGPQVAVAAQAKKQAQRPPLAVSYIVAEGHARFVHLFALCSNQSKTLRITVHVATPQVALFLASVFYALKFEGGHIFCDAEPTLDGTAASKADHGPVVAEIDRLAPGVGCVLFSAFGLVPASGTVFVQFDPMVDIANMASFIAERLTSGIASTPKPTPVAETPAAGRGAKRSRTPPPAPFAAGPPQPAYSHVILFFNPNEVTKGVPLLAATGQRFNMTFTPLTPPRGPTVVMTLSKVSSLHAKVFAIQQQAYDAYRASMQVYARLQPASVYDVAAVNLQKIAEQFGYEEAPLLDLRTKANAFRPKEDYFKAAVRRLKKDRRAFKDYAAANIIGEKPEEDPDLM